MLKQRWIRIYGALVVSFTSIVLFGWLTGNRSLVALFPNTAPMQFNTALSLLMLVLSTMAVANSRRNLSLAFASVPVLFGGLTLLQWIFKVDLGIDRLFPTWTLMNDQAQVPGRPSIFTASLLLLFGTTVAFATLGRGKHLWMIVASNSIFTLIVATSCLAASLQSATFGLTVPWFNQMAPVTAICFLLIGLSGLALARSKHDRQILDFRCLAFATFISILAGTGILAQLEGAQIKKQGETDNKEAASYISNLLTARLHQLANSLQRMSNRIGSGIQDDQLSWRTDAAAYIKDFPDLKAVEWIDKSLHIRWIEPTKGNEQAIGLDITFEGRRREALEKVIASQSPTMTQTITLVQGGKGFLIYIPTFRNGKFLGIVVGVCLVNQFFSSVPETFRKSYSFAVYDAGEKVFTSSPTSSQIAIDEQITLPYNSMGVKWELILRPTEFGLSSRESSMPIIIWMVGILTAAFSTIVIFLLGAAKQSGEKEREAKAFLQNLANTSPATIYTFDLESRSLTYCNRPLLDLLGCSLQELQAQGQEVARKRIHPDDADAVAGRFSDLMQLKDGEFYEFQCRVQAPDGTWRWLLNRECILERGPNGNPLILLGTGQDITSRCKAEMSLRENEELLQTLFDRSPIGEATVDKQGRYMRVNPALCQILGYSSEELLNRTFQSITHPEDLDDSLKPVGVLIDGGGDTYEIEKRYIHKDGHTVWVSLSVAAVRKDGDIFFTSRVQDISSRVLNERVISEYAEMLEVQKQELVAANERLEMFSSTDALTGLFNRRSFTERLNTLFNLRGRYSTTLSVIMIDIDHFKSINDTHGHLVGDDVLIQMGQLLMEAARDSDMVARYGGEEFIILCPQTSALEAKILAERIREKVAAHSFSHGRVTASLGVAEQHDLLAATQDLLALADKALYTSKEEGRNRVTVAGAMAKIA